MYGSWLLLLYRISVHEALSLQVRSVASPSSNLILSASRDTKALAWTRGDESSAFTPSIPFHAGEKFVNAVTYLPPNVEGPNGDRRCILGKHHPHTLKYV